MRRRITGNRKPQVGEEGIVEAKRLRRQGSKHERNETYEQMRELEEEKARPTMSSSFIAGKV